MNLASFVYKWSLATPHHPAIALGTNIVHDYRSLYDRVTRLAGGLRASALSPGDHVAILMENRPEYFECLFACWHAGLAPVPINAKLHAREVRYILDHSQAARCLVSPKLAGNLGGAEVRTIEVASNQYDRLCAHRPIAAFPTQPEQLAWLFYTSGTTGQPKGAMITHRNLLTMALCYAADIDPAPPWRSILHPAPLSHGSGLYAIAHLMKGSCQVLPESAGFEPREIFDLIEAWPDCVFFAAPTMARRLTTHDEDRDAANLKTLIYGGAPMYVADIKAFIERFGPRLSQLYGQGESPMTITGLSSAAFAERSHPRWEQRIASAGLPQSAVSVAVVDEHGAAREPGEPGEIICRGDSVMRGYWRNEPATARTLREGWLWTGDIGSFDEDGFLSLHDRSKDVIISGGANVYPREVEEVLLQHRDVAEVSVIGRPDAEWGEIIVAYVVASGDATPAVSDLDALCLDNIARFKRPRDYRFVDSLPKNNYGKILKTQLRELDTQSESAPD